MIAQRELERAVARPRSVYRTPEDVLADERLDDAQRRRVLESWQREARSAAAARGEAPGNEEPGDEEPAMVGRLADALATLPAQDQRPGDVRPEAAGPASATARGTRLTGLQARQGEIILRTPIRKAIFIGGLALAAVAGVVLSYVAWW